MWGQGPAATANACDHWLLLLLRTFSQHAGGQARAGVRIPGHSTPSLPQRTPSPGSPHSAELQGQALSPLLSQCSPAHPRFLPTSQNAHTNCCLQTYCWLCLQVLGPSPLSPAGASPQLRSHLQEALLDLQALVPFPRTPHLPSLPRWAACDPSTTQPRPSARSLHVPQTCL